MTTPDKEEMPTDRTEGQFRKKPVVVDAVQLRQRFLWPDWFHDAVSSNVIITHGLGKYGTGPVYCEIKTLEGVMRANAGDWVVRGTQGEIYPCKPDIFIEIYEPVGIATACNAHEPMREALILAEKADRIHSKCQECEDGAQAPEACGDCFPSADDARVARRNVLKSLGVRMRDVDRARVAKAEPLTCKCSQEDVHDYGPCDEHCRSQPATAPHDEDLSRLKDALQLADGAFESIRNKLVNNLYEPERSAFWAAVNARDSIRAALSTLPVIDRQTSDDVGILRALLEEELVWHEERDKSLSKQPQSNQTVWRRAEHQERIDVIRAALKGPASEAEVL